MNDALKQPGFAEKFWDAVQKHDTGCWEWTKAADGDATDGKGYGRVYLGRGKKSARAHRVAWELTYGSIPEGLFVCHRCDNRLCVNPSHLFLGTNAENMADCRTKGRLATGARNGRRTMPERGPRGVRNGSAKLTSEQVTEIRQLADQGVPKARIARMFGVTSRTIWCAVLRLTWKEVA